MVFWTWYHHRPPKNDLAKRPLRDPSGAVAFAFWPRPCSRPTKRHYHSMLKCFLGRLGYQGQKPTRFQKGVVFGPAAFGGKANTAPVSNKCCFFSPWYPRPPKNHLAKNILRGPFDRSLEDLTSGTITRCFGELPPPQSARGPPGCRLAGWRRWGPRTKC